MKKRLLVIGSLAFAHFMASAQTRDSVAEVSKTQIDLVYNHYIQDGNNSAVTGGIGTEKLTVYGPSLTIKKRWKNNYVRLQGGADVISSASTDNIDFVMSSASALDMRSYANVEYGRNFEKKERMVYGGMGFSIESDYFSIGSKIGVVKENTKKLTQYSAEFQMFNDDLRWGRLTEGIGFPKELIYPYELRFRQWHEVYRRNSFNLKLGYSKAINKRAIVGVYPLLAYQNGLLATPFHRIFFSDGTQAVENLPDNRYKISVGFRWNQFLGGRYILKTLVNPYIDNWGVRAISLENETAIKLNAVWTILPNARVYVQEGSRFFAPFMGHNRNSDFFTSDFDFSTMQTYSAGIGAKFSPFQKFGKRSQFNAIIFRYNYMQRSDGLRAHILSMNIQLEKSGRK